MRISYLIPALAGLAIVSPGPAEGQQDLSAPLAPLPSDGGAPTLMPVTPFQELPAADPTGDVDDRFETRQRGPQGEARGTDLGLIPAVPMPMVPAADLIMYDLVRGIEHLLIRNTQVSLSLGSAVTGAIQGDRLVVTFPDVTITFEDAQLTAVLGDVNIAIANPGTGRHPFTTVLSDTITLIGPDEVALGVVTIGDNEISGEWWGSLQTFTQISAFASDIAIELSPGPGQTAVPVATIGTLNVAQQLQGREDALWSGVYSVAVTGLDAAPDAASRIQADSLDATLSVEGIDISEIFSLYRNLGVDLTYGPVFRPDILTAEQLQTLITFVENIRFEAGEISVSTADFSMVEDGVDILGLDQMRATLLLRARTELIPLRIGLGYSGAEMDTGLTEAALPMDVLPTAFETVIEFERLPLRPVLGELMPEVVGERAQGLEELTISRSSAERMSRAFNEQEPVLRLDKLVWRAPGLAMDAAGRIEFLRQSAYGAVAGFDLRILQLDRLIGLVRNFTTILPHLDRLDFGRIAGEAEIQQIEGLDQPLHLMRVIVRPDGEVDVNGTQVLSASDATRPAPEPQVGGNVVTTDDVIRPATSDDDGTGGTPATVPQQQPQAQEAPPAPEPDPMTEPAQDAVVAPSELQ